MILGRTERITSSRWFMSLIVIVAVGAAVVLLLISIKQSEESQRQSFVELSEELFTIKSSSLLLLAKMTDVKGELESTQKTTTDAITKIQELQSKGSVSQQQQITPSSANDVPKIKQVETTILKHFIDNAKYSRKILIKTRTIPPFEIFSHFTDRTSLASPVINDFFQFGQYNINKIELFRRILADKKSCQVVDVGANIGTFSLYSAALGHKVIAFEAYDANVKLMKQSIEINEFRDRIVLHGKAVSSSEGQTLSIRRCGEIGHCILRKPSDVDKTDLVTTTTLDDALSTLNEVCLFKINLEGSEADALQGAKKFLERVKPEVIISQFHPLAMVEQKGDPVEYLQFFSSLGYKIFVSDLDGELITADKISEYVARKKNSDLVMYRGERPETLAREPITQSRYYSRHKELDNYFQLSIQNINE